METNNLFCKSSYEAVVIGGGIVGVGVLRDLALHNVDTLLVDKGDFSSQTSQSSSKMLHGGIRYLANFDFSLVKEALHEKNLWLKLAPHLCSERPFCMPVFKESKYPLPMLRIGFHLYDFLSGFQNSPFEILNREQTLSYFPQLKQQSLSGSGLYYDAIMDDAKITLECLYDALRETCVEAHNYIELVGLESAGHSTRLTFQDRFSSKKQTVTAKKVVFATGPFTDQLMQQLHVGHWTPKLLPSKGIHVWLPESCLQLQYPLVLQTKDDRVVFVIPQKNAILVGTTESEVREDYFNIQASEQEIEYLLEILNSYFPQARVQLKDVLSSFAGVRPLLKDPDTTDPSKTSRTHAVFRPFKNTYVLIGGKYTTFRIMAQDVVRPIVESTGSSYNEFATLRPLRCASAVPFNQFHPLKREQILQILQKERVKTFEDLIQRRIGVPNQKHWREGTSFKDFFNPLRSELARLKNLPDDFSSYQR